MARTRRPPRPGGRPAGRKRRPRTRAAPQPAPQLPDTAQARLEEETRRAVLEVVRARAADRGLSETERLLARIMDQHPEYATLFSAAADHVVTGDGASPFLHVALHRIVEQRVVTRELGDEMSRLARDRSWHEAVHVVAGQLASELFAGGDRAASGG